MLPIAETVSLVYCLSFVLHGCLNSVGQQLYFILFTYVCTVCMCTHMYSLLLMTREQSADTRFSCSFSNAGQMEGIPVLFVCVNRALGMYAMMTCPKHLALLTMGQSRFGVKNTMQVGVSMRPSCVYDFFKELQERRAHQRMILEVAPS